MGISSQLDADFDEWWQRFPRKVGKLAARKEYDKVRRGGITQEELLDGIAQYLAAKASYADLVHPRTFLSQGRWMDEATPVVAPTVDLGKQSTRLVGMLKQLSGATDDH